MADIFEGRPVWPLRALGECERGIYRLCGIDPAAQMSWKQYALCLLLFNALGALALYALSAGRHGCRSTAEVPGVSRARPSHRGELHHQHQLAGLFRGVRHELPHADGGLTVQNFLSAASGMVVAIALIRGSPGTAARPSATCGWT